MCFCRYGYVDFDKNFTWILNLEQIHFTKSQLVEKIENPDEKDLKAVHHEINGFYEGLGKIVY